MSNDEEIRKEEKRKYAREYYHVHNEHLKKLSRDRYQLKKIRDNVGNSKRKRGTGGYNSSGHIVKNINGKKIPEHRLIWEQHNGPIPEGYHIHHINGVKDDNRIGNLMIVTPNEHMKIHNGYQLIDGVWWKKCNVCGVLKPLTDYHSKNNNVVYLCKVCRSANDKKYKKLNKTKLSEHYKEYYHNNIEKIKEYNEKNKERIKLNHKEYSKKYRSENVEKLKKDKHEYYIKNKDRINKQNMENYYKNKAKKEGCNV